MVYSLRVRGLSATNVEFLSYIFFISAVYYMLTSKEAGAETNVGNSKVSVLWK